MRRSITSRSFSYEVQDGLCPLFAARARNANLTTSLRKSFGLAIPAGFSLFDEFLLKRQRLSVRDET